MSKIIAAIFYILIIFYTLCAFSQELVYPSSYREATDMIIAKNKPGFIFLMSENCEPCERLKKDVLSKYYNILNSYYVVYIVDVDKEKNVKDMFLRTQSKSGKRLWNGIVPAYFVFSRDMKAVLATGYGYKSPKEFALWYNYYVVNAIINYDSGKYKRPYTPRNPYPYQNRPLPGT